MFHLDLKRVETAIAAGRLEEAFSLLKSSSARVHRDGQRLVDELIEAFVQRGHEHLSENRLDDAWHDASAAGYFGGRQIKVARLIAQIHELQQSQRRDLGQPAADRARSSPAEAGATGGNVLQVDGLGSLLLLTSETVSIGTVSSSSRHEIAVQTDGLAATIFIQRDESGGDGEDYFVRSASPFALNGKPTQQRLLSDGDTISVGRHGRMKFRRPVAASGSAVLEMTAGRLTRRDIRRVVLMADSLLFGESLCHFHLAVGETPVIMQPAVGVSLGSGYSLQRQGGLDPQTLCVGGSVRIGDTRFALSHPSNTGPRF
ncbi:hypothetical protein Q31b_55310 [Novipirellula aureliae]|uniref:FHA domain-containing protein n=1 Tax=Novipirellula aureliae TaxID=2527966 RepID=A0A5C6DHQ8_9BACT|nr:hypothetical protein [Novipirellula aureliae]TWU34576.1 hypothetical protein Q31b_55310 [Novipirellula aureliae]